MEGKLCQLSEFCCLGEMLSVSLPTDCPVIYKRAFDSNARRSFPSREGPQGHVCGRTVTGIFKALHGLE